MQPNTSSNTNTQPRVSHSHVPSALFEASQFSPADPAQQPQQRQQPQPQQQQKQRQEQGPTRSFDALTMPGIFNIPQEIVHCVESMYVMPVCIPCMPASQLHEHDGVWPGGTESAVLQPDAFPSETFVWVCSFRKDGANGDMPDWLSGIQVCLGHEQQVVLGLTREQLVIDQGAVR